jgi:hypothetical protein
MASKTAVAAALAVARSHRLRCDEPVVLRDAWHVLLHLRPLPIVARVSSGRPFPDGPKEDDVVRELDVAAHAWRNGAPVVPPADEVEPLPYHEFGHIVTFWRYIAPHQDFDPAEAGRGLRAVHEALEDYDALLPAVGHSGETREMLAAAPPSRHVDLLHEIASRVGVSEGQALHGDAHLGNCLGAPAGPLWHDFETACQGPPEYDLAALVATDRVVGRRADARRALAAYGAHDAELLDELLPLYVVWVTASMLTALPRRPELAEAIDVRIGWLARR